MKAKSARQKGKDLEDHVADQIVALGIDPKARRDGGSGAGNREKGDIVTTMMVLGQNAGIECKNQHRLDIPGWWRQTKKLQDLSREPILAFKFHGESLDNTKVVIHLDTFLRLVKASQEPRPKIQEDPEVDYGNDRELKYKGQRVISAMKDFLKVINSDG